MVILDNTSIPYGATLAWNYPLASSVSIKW